MKLLQKGHFFLIWGGGSQCEWFMYFNDSSFLMTLQRRQKETKITTSREKKKKKKQRETEIEGKAGR